MVAFSKPCEVQEIEGALAIHYPDHISASVGCRYGPLQEIGSGVMVLDEKDQRARGECAHCSPQAANFKSDLAMSAAGNRKST